MIKERVRSVGKHEEEPRNREPGGKANFVSPFHRFNQRREVPGLNVFGHLSHQLHGVSVFPFFRGTQPLDVGFVHALAFVRRAGLVSVNAKADVDLIRDKLEHVLDRLFRVLPLSGVGIDHAAGGVEHDTNRPPG